MDNIIGICIFYIILPPPFYLDYMWTLRIFALMNHTDILDKCISVVGVANHSPYNSRYGFITLKFNYPVFYYQGNSIIVLEVHKNYMNLMGEMNFYFRNVIKYIGISPQDIAQWIIDSHQNKLRQKRSENEPYGYFG